MCNWLLTFWWWMGCSMNVISSLEVFWGDATLFLQGMLSWREQAHKSKSKNKPAGIKSETTPLPLPNPNMKGKQTCDKPFLRCEERQFLLLSRQCFSEGKVNVWVNTWKLACEISDPALEAERYESPWVVCACANCTALPALQRYRG